MNRATRQLEAAIRRSLVYARWVKRHKKDFCVRCGRRDSLHCHHFPDMLGVMFDAHKMYRKLETTNRRPWEAVREHVLYMHEMDKFDGITMCVDCHDKEHPGREIAVHFHPRNADGYPAGRWCVVPRNVEFPLRHGKTTELGLTCVGFQCVFALGWHLLRGSFSQRRATLDTNELARLMGKQPGTMFRRSVDREMGVLGDLNVLAGHRMEDRVLEVEISEAYPPYLSNPWFFPIKDTHTASNLTLALRLWLSYQGNRRRHRINTAKLANHLCLRSTSPAHRERMIRRACDGIWWARIHSVQPNGLIDFRLRPRGRVPIFSLRHIMDERMTEQGVIGFYSSSSPEDSSSDSPESSTPNVSQGSASASCSILAR